jgi:hypothetical protein
MIYRTSPDKIAKYFQSEGISQSKLKLVSKGVDFYLANKEKLAESDKYFDEPAEHFIIGSAVDCKVTEGDEVFNQKYKTSTLTSKPSDTLISIMRYVFDKIIASDIPVNVNGIVTIDATTVFPLTSYSNYIIEACEVEKYQPRWGADAKINAVTKDTGEYWNEMIASVGKQILTLEQFNLVQRIAASFEVLLSQYIVNENVDIFFQFPLYNYLSSNCENNIDCKGLADIIIIDHSYRTIKIIDLKTMGDSVINFLTQLRRRRYDIQISFYYDLLNSLMVGKNVGILSKSIYNLFPELFIDNKFMNVDSYIVEKPEFWVQSTVFDNNAVIYVTTNELLQIGRFGRSGGVIPFSFNNDNTLSSLPVEKINGYKELLDTLFYIENGNKKHPEVFYIDWNLTNIGI